ncbi:MAG: hypothetical protein O2888_01465, partial [Chloroflexi bacterium]|nr:hypothetical protein [Chloroflexota bacterium]
MIRAGLRGVLAAGLLVALAAAPVLTRAQPVTPPIEVAGNFIEAAATVGDRVRLAVRVTHPDAIVVTVQRPILHEFEYISSSGPETQVLGSGLSQTTVTFTFQVFTLGETAPVPLAVDWVDEEGTTGRIAAASRPLLVAS